MGTPLFEHEPLDYSQPTIRILKLSRRSSKAGLVRCKIKHTTIHSKYTCLSYRWGQLDDGDGPSYILINNKAYRVRQNLHEFLQRAQSRLLGWLWVDAICIDQENTTERNHQVRHMGEIYCRAKEVLVWLGDCLDAARYLWLASSRLRFSIPVTSECNIGGSAVRLMHEYWQRAWVTQEILLARRVKFMASTVIVKSAFVARVEFDEQGYRMRDSLENLIAILMGNIEMKNLGLLQLLEKMQNKKCLYPRDKLFSLLAICKEGENITVDYDQPIGAFLYHVLTRVHTSCLCMVKILTECADLPSALHKRTFQDEHFDNFILEIKLKSTTKKMRELETVCVQDASALRPGEVEHICRYCNVELTAYNKKGYHVFCLQMICKYAHGHLHWSESDDHVLKFQDEIFGTGSKEFQSLVLGWGNIQACDPFADEHVLRFTLRGLAQIIHYGFMRIHDFHLPVFLCDNFEMGGNGGKTSRLYAWSILHSSRDVPNEQNK